MPTLDWIGKKAVMGYHRQVPYHLLRCDNNLSVGDAGSGNLLVEGDNLLALKALLPYYAGQVKCIYIDPPYNTGKERWIYNDNVNSPEIRKWLGKVVGAEAEDLCRHAKWLCMMYPRLRLLRDFLSHDGVIFISIGRDEVGRLRDICDEIFGSRNLLEIFIWQIEGNTENQEDITAVHEYIVAYEKTPGAAKIRTTIDPNVPSDSKLRRDFAENSVIKNGPGNPPSVVELPIGFPSEIQEMDLPPHDFAGSFMAEVQKVGYIMREMKSKYNINYPLRLDRMVVEGGQLAQPCRVYSGWSSARKFGRFIELNCDPLDDDDGSKLRYFLSKNGVPTYRRESRTGHFVPTILRNMGTTERASNELERMGIDFDYPKPVPLIKYLISLYTQPGDLIMDSFVGSGTTGHAVMNLNAEDGGARRFVLVELESEIASQVTAKRLSCVVNGYKARRGSRTVQIDGLGGGFRYCKLAEPLFDEGGNIRPEVNFADLAAHIYFTETGEPLPKQPTGKTPLIGECKGTAYYLLFNGVVGDKRPNGGNVLTGRALRLLPPHEGPRVVYGEGCRLQEVRLKRERIVFKQIPYDIRVS